MEYWKSENGIPTNVFYWNMWWAYMAKRPRYFFLNIVKSFISNTLKRKYFLFISGIKNNSQFLDFQMK